MASGAVVGDIETMDGTKTSCKVNIFETNSPAKGANLGPVSTIRSSHEIRRRESGKGGNRNILRRQQSINNIIMACGNMQMLKEKLTPPKERREVIKNVGGLGRRDQKLVWRKLYSDVVGVGGNRNDRNELIRNSARSDIHGKAVPAVSNVFEGLKIGVL